MARPSPDARPSDIHRFSVLEDPTLTAREFSARCIFSNKDYSWTAKSRTRIEIRPLNRSIYWKIKKLASKDIKKAGCSERENTLSLVVGRGRGGVVIVISCVQISLPCQCKLCYTYIIQASDWLSPSPVNYKSILSILRHRWILYQAMSA